MNYRHAYHAGNFADCMKHAILVWLLQQMWLKDPEFFVLDCHAGGGRTDLNAGPAAQTLEWRAGIGRLLDETPPALFDYVDLVRRIGLYPGSTGLIHAMLRPQDRAAFCELHEEDYRTLKRQFAHDSRVGVHRRDGWEALEGLLPPKEGRGIVLIDPPYELPDEYERLYRGIRRGLRRFKRGVFAGWFPIKHYAPVRALYSALRSSGVADIVAVELRLREPVDPAKLNGCGMVVVNPPFRFEQQIPSMLGALAQRLGGREASWKLERLADD